VRDEGEGGLEV